MESELESSAAGEGALFRQSIKGVFIPVVDIDRAQKWYREVLGLPVGDILNGHLCCAEMESGATLLLDARLTPDRTSPLKPEGAYPLCMIATDNIESCCQLLMDKGVEIILYDGKAIQNGHWFNFRDCEGNLLMACGPI